MLIFNIQVSSNLALPIKRCEPEKIYLIFEKKGENPPKSHRTQMKITRSDSAYQRALL